MASQELGTLLLALMPRRGEGWHWDRLANGPVHWLDKPVLRQRGEHGEAGLNSRTGIVRVNVLGQPVTVLRQRQDEVWWTLRYLSRTDLKWGVESITLAPGLPWGEDCWGLFYEGCHFYVASSLRRAGVRAEVICKDGPLGAPVTLMRLSHYGRASVLLKLKANLGSGGADASLELHSGEAEVDCSE